MGSDKPLGRNTPAMEAAQRFASRAKGKTFLVTGAGSGLGFEAARCLAAVGGRVTVAARSQAAAEDAVKRMRAALGNAGATADLSPLALDLSSLASVEAGAKAFLAATPSLDVLINNAGVMAAPLTTTPDGLETQIGVNHVAHQYFTSLVMPALVAAGTPEEPSRVVDLSSIANWLFAPDEGIIFDNLPPNAATYHPWSRYGESKLANILHAKELTRRCAAAGQNVIGISLHPGNIMATKLMRHFNFSRAWAMVRALWRRKGATAMMLKEGQKTIPAGSSTTVVASLNPDLKGGEFLANCQINTIIVHPKAYDEALAAKLWEWTEATVARIRAGSQ